MLLWIDGFEGYNTIDQQITSTRLLRRYQLADTPFNAVYARVGRIAGLSLECAFTNVYAITPILTTNATLIAGVAIKIPTLPPMYPAMILALYDDAALGMNVRITTAGGLGVYLGNTPLAITADVSLTVGAWYYIEFKVLCASLTGTYELRVDNTIKLSDTTTTKAGTHDYNNKIGIYNSSLGNCFFDDYYICDGSGILNNDFLGPCRILASNPDGDNSVNWSTRYPANGDHYLTVADGALADDDTTYVEDNTTGHRDLFEYGSVSTLTSIHGLAINTTCKVTDVNDVVDLKIIIESGGSEEVSSAKSISSTDYITISQISETDPNTSAPWENIDLNAAQFGFEVG